MKALKGKEQYIPYLTDEMIESQVREDLRKYQKILGRSLTFPLFPEEIIPELWGVEVEFCNEVVSSDGEQVLACFLPGEQKVCVSLSFSGNAGRTSFTLAHEMGHVSLHKFLSEVGEERTLCRGALSEHDKNEMLEKQADKYASMLLMPKEILLAQLDEMGYIATKSFDITPYSRPLKEFFGVSSAALEIRLAAVGVVAAGGFYGVKPKKVAESYYEEREIERQGWNMDGRC